MIVLKSFTNRFVVLNSCDNTLTIVNTFRNSLITPRYLFIRYQTTITVTCIRHLQSVSRTK